MKVNDRHCSFYYENDNDYGPIEIDPKKTALLIIGMAVSIWVVVASSLSLDFAGWMSLVLYMLVGVAIMVGMNMYRKSHPGELEVEVLTPDQAAE